MRILHISSLYHPDQIGGAEVMVELLAETQAAAGHSVAVACISRHEEPPGLRNGVTIYRTGFATPYFILDRDKQSRLNRLHYRLAAKINREAMRRFDAAIADFKPDVVNTHSLSELPPQIWTVAKRRGVTVVHTIHDYKSICSKGSMFRDGKACNAQHLKCRLISHPHYQHQVSVDAITGVGTEILERHLDAGLFGHVPSALRRVIFNPIEPPAVPRNRQRASGSDIVFGCLGRIEPSKGVDTLLDACRLLPATGWKLIVAGRATDGIAPYQARAVGLPVDFAGFVQRDVFFDQIDCLVVPAVWPEAFGRTVAEALMRGLPVIGSRIAGITEQIGDEAQWLFSPGDARALAERMKAVLDDPGRLLQKTKAMDQIASRVSPEDITRRYLDLYRSALQ
ncbi:glycosyltransferase family 4 protein [Bradyrhizobium sp. I71]|nr:glycosyltransferase family 4 protein [Bradyrhizobium sp. I71]